MPSFRPPTYLALVLLHGCDILVDVGRRYMADLTQPSPLPRGGGRGWWPSLAAALCPDRPLQQLDRSPERRSSWPTVYRPGQGTEPQSATATASRGSCQILHTINLPYSESTERASAYRFPSTTLPLLKTVISS